MNDKLGMIRKEEALILIIIIIIILWLYNTLLGLDLFSVS
jgi:hypothetical protein